MLSHQALASRADFETYCRERVRLVPIERSLAAVRVLGGPLLLLDLRDVQIAVHLAMDGFWESWITLAVARHVRSGWRCIDVGANCGYYTVLLGALAGPAGRVWAWEPHPELARTLRESIHLNGMGSFVAVEEAAATDRTGACRLHLPARDFRNSLNGSIVADFNGEAIPVAGRTLDEVCAGAPIDFIKIDVEGAEMLTWEGMAAIRRQNPSLTVLLEYHVGRYADPPAFIARMTGAGFLLRYVDYDGSIRDVSASELLAPGHGDWMLWLTRAR